MKSMPAVTMEWVIFFTDGDTFTQSNLYPYDYETWMHKREKIIEECVHIYGDNIEHIDFSIIVDVGIHNKLESYWHKKALILSEDKNHTEGKDCDRVLKIVFDAPKLYVFCGLYSHVEELFIVNNIVYYYDDYSRIVKIDVLNGTVVDGHIDDENLISSSICKEINVQEDSIIYPFVYGRLLYCAGVWIGDNQFDTEKRCNSITNGANKDLEEYGINATLTTTNWRFEHNNKNVTLQEVLEAIEAIE